MRWAYLTWGLVGVGSLAACHSGGDAAPSSKAPAATAEGATAQEAAAGGAPAALAPTPPQEPAAPVTTASSPAADADCETRRAAIETALGEAGRCASDADCTLMYPNCPFGCARPIAKSTDLGALQATIEKYKAACNSCAYRCMPPPGAPTCKAGRCAFGAG